MKLYNDLPLSYWVDTLRVNVFCHRWGTVSLCVRAICFIIDRPDLFEFYLLSDFGTDDYSDSISKVVYAACCYLEG